MLWNRSRLNGSGGGVYENIVSQELPKLSVEYITFNNLLFCGQRGTVGGSLVSSVQKRGNRIYMKRSINSIIQ